MSRSQLSEAFTRTLPVAVLLIFCFCGCVRVAGTAGYWHTSEKSGTTAKQAGFDTAALVSDPSAPGKIKV